jgi:hypothetical protein
LLFLQLVRGPGKRMEANTPLLDQLAKPVVELPDSQSSGLGHAMEKFW